MSPAELVRRALSDLSPGDGWASRTLHVSLRRAILLALCVWQVVMLWAVANTDAPLADKCWLGLAHVGLMALALMARSGRFPAGLLLVLVYAVVLWDWTVAESIEGVLAFAGCWLVNLAAAAPAAVMRGRRAIVLPILSAFLVGIGLYAVNPDWGLSLPSAVPVTTLALVAGTRLGLPFLIDFARRADAETSAAEDEVRKVAVVRSASEEAAEDARILHDTVINTLSAIANGGAGIADLDAVRERCAQDAATVEEVRAVRQEQQAGAASLREIFAASGPMMRRTGLEDHELEQVERALPDKVIRMIVGAVTELLQNVGKHAQADHVVVDVRVEGEELVVTVTDDGIGFDGAVPPSRGFATSVLGRAEEAGASVVLNTEPGRGTEVALRMRLDLVVEPELADTLDSQAQEDLEGVVTALRTQAAWLWAFGVVAGGFAIEVVNRPGQFTAAYWMLAVAGLVSALAWSSRRRFGGFPAATVVMLALGASIAFLLSAAAVDFGRTEAIHWQAVGSTGPLIVLLASVPRRAVLLGSLGLFAATVGAITAVVWQDTPAAAAIVPVAGVTALGFVAGWGGFQRAISTIGARAVADHHLAVRLRLDSAVRIAAAESRTRWRAAGLDEAVKLLRGMAEGRSDPLSSSTRAACVKEEAYLRQLTQLNPDLVRMGQWFARALSDARGREALLVVRTGEVDTPDGETATLLGEALVGAVASIPTGAMLNATLFPTSDGLQMMLVSSRLHLAATYRAWSPSPTSTVTYQTVGDQDLLQIVVHDDPASMRRDRDVVVVD